MRRAIVVVLLLLGAVASGDDGDGGDDDEAVPASFDPTATHARGFDHVAHDGKVTVSGLPSIECATCHPLDRKGAPKAAPTHATCYGACHGAAPEVARLARKQGGKLAATAIDEAAAKLCVNCHAPADLGALVAGTAAKLPAYAGGYGEPDYGIAISHAGHDGETSCTTCHGATGGRAAGKPHARCATCHLAADAALPLATCTGCHTLAGEARPELDHGPLAVTFTHAGHAAKAKADCRACHAKVAAATDAVLGAIGPADCRGGGCHDGGGAVFATTEACTRCHGEAPDVTYPLDRPHTRFSHARHRTRLADTTCTTCHAVDANGEAPPPPHRACADAACHQTDFQVQAPETCGACHGAIEPWRKLHADALPRIETEFGAAMPHARHADLAPTCAGCHSLDNGRRQRRPPRGHASCTGAGCHVAAGGPAPQLTSCATCHQPGLVSEQVHDRTTAEWSVRARFDHDAHTAECTTCHDQVSRTDALPAPPTKARCAQCHDGATAFKMTGHACAKCHGSQKD